ncbi:WD_REPEATS_REGION domain-containing protein [Trichonephila clavipes]|nr:WD_REPEATS_REGION domain-containing protein [Trichonephila clavipes]
MKRQSVGLRRGSEESRSQINENKRLKVFHPQEENLANHDLEAGSGSDSTEEYINVNGQDRNMKNSIISENGSSFQQSPEKNILHNSTAKSSFVIFEEKASASNHVNGNYLEDESCSVKITSINRSMNGSGETSLEVNSSFTDHVNSLNSVNDASQVQENSITEAVESFQSSNADLTTNKKSDIEAQHTLPDNSEVTHLPSEVINEPNVEQSLHLPSTSETFPEEYSGEKSVSEDISGSLDNLKESYTSEEETNSQNVIKVPSASQKCIDIENITLCQLKVVQLEGHADVVFCVDADEDFILSSSGDTTVKVWDVEEGKEISNFAGHNAAVTSVILLSSTESEALRSKLNCFQASRIAVSASYDCHIRLWSVLDGYG